MSDFRKPTRDTLLPFLRLELTPEQTAARLVAPTAVTLAQDAYDPSSEVWFIYDKETPVGLVALWDPAHPEADLEDGDDPKCLFLWRLFIDHRHQKAGHGSAALNFLLKRARELGRSKVKTSYVPHETQSAAAFYEAFGFSPTGRLIDEDEIEMVLEVT